MQIMAPMDADTTTHTLVFVGSLIALLVAHQVGDHVVQTDRQAADKAAGGARAVRAMLGHLLGYHLTAAVVLLGTATLLGWPLTAAGTVAGLAFSAVTHALLDLRWPVRAVLRATRAPKFAETTSPVCGMYTADQALHWLALLVSALLIATL